MRSISDEFSQLKAQLQGQVSILQKARSNLVRQISTAEGAAPAQSPPQVLTSFIGLRVYASSQSAPGSFHDDD